MLKNDKHTMVSQHSGRDVSLYTLITSRHDIRFIARLSRNSVSYPYPLRVQAMLIRSPPQKGRRLGLVCGALQLVIQSISKWLSFVAVQARLLGNVDSPPSPTHQTTFQNSPSSSLLPFYTYLPAYSLSSLSRRSPSL